MSSHSDNVNPPSSSQFAPPVSAQPYRSIFGGPSSDASPLPSSQPSPVRKSIFGGSKGHVGSRARAGPLSGDPDEDDFHALLRERPLEADYNSEGESFQGSWDGEDTPGLESEPDLPRHPSSRTASKSPSKNAQPTSYVLNRGLDLLPGAQRPNRWKGPARTYQWLTADGRDAYEAIIANRSMDLAAHLYDSFVLRNQKGGENLGPDDESDDPAAVKKVWVGWPMLADNVPRSEENIRRNLFDEDTYRMPPDMRPSADLEESIIANMLRVAKGQFQNREWAQDEARLPRGRSQEESQDKMETHDEIKHDESEPDSIIDEEPLRPVFQADDDKSRRQLRPLSRHIISDLDKVLMGLHYAMRGRTQTRAQARSRTRDDEESESDSEEETSRPHSSERKRKRDRYIHKRGEQRDWSEVLGIAAMSGISPDVIMRTSKRCADLFGQDMEFQRLHEGRMVKTEHISHEQWHQQYVEGDAEAEKKPAKKKARRKSSKKQAEGDEVESVQPVRKPRGKGEHRKADIVCPIPSCPRHENGFSRTWNLTLHMRNAHGRERGQEGKGKAIEID